MDVEPYLQPRTQRVVSLPLDYRRRCELRQLLGEELYGEPLSGRSAPFTTEEVLFFDPENRVVSAGDLFFDNREWTVVDTMFGSRYLTIVDYKGGFVLMALLEGVDDVLVEFDRPVDPNDRPNRHEDDNFNPVPSRRRQQYLVFLYIAARLVAQSERESRS